MKCYTAICITRDNQMWILIRGDRNLSTHCQELMRFENSFSIYLLKSKKAFLTIVFAKCLSLVSLLNLNSNKKIFHIFHKIHLPWYLIINSCLSHVYNCSDHLSLHIFLFCSNSFSWPNLSSCTVNTRAPCYRGETLHQQYLPENTVGSTQFFAIESLYSVSLENT